MRTRRHWLDGWPSLQNAADLVAFQSSSEALLERLADDRRLLTQLVDEIERDPARLDGSRVTLLLNRLCVYQAPERGFEVRIMNPRSANQLVPHDHAYHLSSRVLRGGYLHAVHRRTDAWEGFFSGDDLLPSVVSVEQPGSSYTLGHAMVHQAVMLPGTVTLFVHSPRWKPTSHAATDLMPPVTSWPAPADPGDAPQHSRPARLDEYRAMRSELLAQGVIG
ncbi:hypothetical protein [Streptomyces sp. NBC_01431]|uniref:hypothetical protein n=1 Tax=Streptomyces sp. NBC_01431 TaxID=2903863 RepID=UPI002E337997|nr:hypothetical protein [Streptomyces sp. NBC_01431]